MRALDRRLQVLDVRARSPRQRPLGGQRVGALHDLDRVERLLDDQERVALAQPRPQVLPRVVRVGRADDHLQERIGSPDLLDGLDPVPAGRHAHVDERERVGPASAVGGGHPLEGLTSLKRRVELELAGPGGLLGAEQHRGELVHGRLGGARSGQDLPEVAVNGLVVVDNQDSPVHVSGDGRHSPRSIGRRVGRFRSDRPPGAPMPPPRTLPPRGHRLGFAGPGPAGGRECDLHDAECAMPRPAERRDAVREHDTSAVESRPDVAGARAGEARLAG